LPIDELQEGNIPRISAKSDNNGVLGFFDTYNNEKARHFKNFISVNFFGSEGGIFYHPYEASVEMKVHSLKMPDRDFTPRTGLFIVNALITALDGFSYGSQLSSSKLKSNNYIISLPIKKGEIDFEFMENFVAELEAQRVAELEAQRVTELEAYLTVTGLKDYELTEEEKQTVEEFDKVQWSEFKFEDMFDQIKQGRRLKIADQISGDIPFVMSGVIDTGVANYISNPINAFPSNSITIDIFGNTFYRNYEFSAGDDTGVYWSDKKNYSRETMLFLASSAEKALAGKYSYGKKLRSSQSKKILMKLPISSKAIDYNYMNTLISAIKKLVIKDVVLCADKKIEMTKKIVNFIHPR
jgi:hypothetical protein